MKVCFFINTLDNSGGTERITTVLANELLKKRYEVHIITWYGGNISFYPADDNIKIHWIFKNKIGNIYKDYLKSLKIYRKLLLSILPDFVIDVCVPLSLLTIPAVLGTRIKVIAWEHFNTNVSWNLYTAKISRHLVAKYAYRVITLTNTDKKNYELKFKAKKVICIPNPVTVKPDGKADLFKKNILSIGRFTEQKGFDLLLTIWQKVVAKNPDWKLRIIGDGELKLKIIDLASSLGIANFVEFIAPTNNVAEYYKSSSIYMMTSRFEGLPLVLIEAKAFGLPIISYDCNTGPKDIINHGKDGILVPFLDSDKFEQELNDLMNDLQRRMNYSEFAQKDAARFSINTFISSWQMLLV